MSNKRQIARRIKKEIRAEDCSEIAVEAINRHLTISINGKLNQKTLIRSLVGMSANKLSVHSINKAVEKVPCETSVRYHLLKVDFDSLLALQSMILTYSNDQILVPGKSYHFAINSTTTFYSYVSLYITTKGQRLTIAVLPVKKGVMPIRLSIFIPGVTRLSGLLSIRKWLASSMTLFIQDDNLWKICSRF
jgi:putative transposase